MCLRKNRIRNNKASSFQYTLRFAQSTSSTNLLSRYSLQKKNHTPPFVVTTLTTKMHFFKERLTCSSFFFFLYTFHYASTLRHYTRIGIVWKGSFVRSDDACYMHYNKLEYNAPMYIMLLYFKMDYTLYRYTLKKKNNC